MSLNVSLDLQDLKSLRMVVDMAISHVLDVESGLLEGIYEESENFDLPAKQSAVANIEAVLARFESPMKEGHQHGN